MSEVENAINVVSLSGGKDSTALALLAIEREAPGVRFVWADTGHEHPETVRYVEYLDAVFRDRYGLPGVDVVRADFRERIANKRKFVAQKWPEHGIPEDRVQKALEALRPTGNPFLDLCLWKGRLPSTRARFCTQELKHFPIAEYMAPLCSLDDVVSWQGVRRDESPSRRGLPEWDDDPLGWRIYRPLLDWTAKDVFAFHRRHNVAWNPLYEQGMRRVGCMPCIHAGKPELREIAKRFPAEVDRVERWERAVADASKRGLATFFASDKTPGDHVGETGVGIRQVMEWSLTARGGRQGDLLHAAEAGDPPLCSSVYGLCE